MRLSAANAMRFVDDVFDEIMQSIKDAGQWENTIVLFTSDNGGSNFPQSVNNNFPLRGGKRSIFEGGYRIVQFLSGGWFDNKAPQQQQQPRKSDTVVFINDWAPTFLDMVGGLAAVDKLYKKELDSSGE
jgi:arylsulfatase B/arylsulfatase I/J